MNSDKAVCISFCILFICIASIVISCFVVNRIYDSIELQKAMENGYKQVLEYCPGHGPVILWEKCDKNFAEKA